MVTDRQVMRLMKHLREGKKLFAAADKAGMSEKTARKQRNRKTHSVEIAFFDEKVTSFGGMILEHRLAQRMGLWRKPAKRLPARRGVYSWLDVIQPAVAGLLTGSRGTFAAEEVREDEALLQLLDLDGAPEEATFWRCLEGLGEMSLSGFSRSGSK